MDGLAMTAEAILESQVEGMPRKISARKNSRFDPESEKFPDSPLYFLVRAVAQPGSALAWGARGQEFKSPRPDQILNGTPFFKISDIRYQSSVGRGKRRKDVSGKFEDRQGQIKLHTERGSLHSEL